MRTTDTDVENALFQNASMGVSSIRQVLPKVHSKDLKGELIRQLNYYHDESNTAVSELKSANIKPKQESLMARAMAKAGIAFNLAKDNSTANIAEMMIQGTNMGIINVNRALNGSKNLSPDAAKQAKKMLVGEQQYIDSLKKYL